jgi:hypothetical protein
MVEEANNTPESLQILTKPLPQILDEMDANSRAAASAAKQAEAAARKAQETEGSILKAAEQAVAESQRFTTEAIEKMQDALVEATKRKVIASWEMTTLLLVLVLAAIFASVAISLGLGLLS